MRRLAGADRGAGCAQWDSAGRAFCLKKRRKISYGNTIDTTGGLRAHPSYLGPFIIVTALFGIFGFLDQPEQQAGRTKLEDIFQSDPRTGDAGDGGVVFCVSGLLSARGKLIEAVGYKRTMVISLFMMVVGALLFVPAATMVSFNLTLFDGDFCTGDGCLRAADLSQSLCFDSWTRAHRAGAAEPGAGFQFARLGDCAAGLRRRLSWPIRAKA